MAFAALLIGTELARADPARIRFDVPPSRGDRALTLFARQANIQLLFRYDVVSRLSLPGVSGDFTVGEALTVLTGGSCLRAEFQTSRGIVLADVRKGGFWIMNSDACRRSRFKPTLAAGLLGVSAAAEANEPQVPQAGAAGALDEVIVTARKRAESLMDVPVSVVAMSATTIERQGIDNLRDIGTLVPNLNLSARTDGYPNVTIRGVGGFGNTQGVGFYLDDVQLFTDASSRFGDLERIEVIKGPQGTLYGGSNIGGAIKFVSARPDPTDTKGSIKLRVGERNIVDVEGSINAPLGRSGWAFRGFAFVAEDDGYITNQNPPRVNGVRGNNKTDIGYSDEAGVRLALAGPIGDQLNVYASVRWNQLKGSATPGSARPATTSSTCRSPTTAPTRPSTGRPSPEPSSCRVTSAT